MAVKIQSNPRQASFYVPGFPGLPVMDCMSLVRPVNIKKRQDKFPVEVKEITIEKRISLAAVYHFRLFFGQ